MFWTRLASGVVLLAAAIATMFIGGIPLVIVLWTISMIAFRELTKTFRGAVDKNRPNVPEIIGFAGITGYYLLLYFGNGHTWLFLCVALVFMAELFAYVLTFPLFHTEQIAATVFAFLYAPVMLSFVYLTRECEMGVYLVWMILISSWGCDTCAYAVGKLIGRKKIFPELSPKKSLEGCIGGVAGAALLGWLYGFFVVGNASTGRRLAWIMAFICAVGAVMSMVGDLAASAIKRNHEIKDYGKLIPGHGGIMDRFDSMIVTAPMTYFLTVLILGL